MSSSAADHDLDIEPQIPAYPVGRTEPKMCLFGRYVLFGIMGILIIALSVALSKKGSSSTTCITTAKPGDKEAEKLYDDYFGVILQYSPESGTYLGFKEYDDRLSNLTESSSKARTNSIISIQKRANSTNPSQLSASVALSLEALKWELEVDLESDQYHEEYLPINQLQGPQIDLPQLVHSTVFSSSNDLENYLQRLAAISDYLDEMIASMRNGIVHQIVYPRVILDPVQGQISALLVEDVAKSVFFEPFLDSSLSPLNLDQATKTQYQERAKNIISQGVLPAFDRLLSFWVGTYLPATRTSIAASDLPNGANYYQFKIKQQTSTNRTADEVHSLGLSEVSRIRGEMNTVITSTGFVGSFQDFVNAMKANASFYLSTEDQFLQFIRDTAKRADPWMAKFFKTLPRCPYGVLPIPAESAPSAPSAYYYEPAADCSRPGYYYVNTYDLSQRPTYSFVSTTLHETVPGHHLQLALQSEATDLPSFRKYGGNTGFVEGWALYSEHLGYEMSFYDDPYVRFGALGDEMLRACRLVVDSGMHSKGWTREQAVQYMLDNTPLSELDIRSEVDRYIAWPGQACAYKSGELVIKQLRDDASEELGTRFDLREFHQVILGPGALPLFLLQEQVDNWIATVKTPQP